MEFNQGTIHIYNVQFSVANKSEIYLTQFKEQC